MANERRSNVVEINGSQISDVIVDISEWVDDREGRCSVASGKSVMAGRGVRLATII